MERLRIIDNTIIQYDAGSRKEEDGFSRHCDSFSLPLTDIKLIAICPRLPFDDEWLFTLLIDKNGQAYPIPDEIIGSEAIKIIEQYFELASIRDVEWKKFSYDEHVGFKAKIIYPKRLYGQSLYRKPFESWQSFTNNLGRWIGAAHSTSGIYTQAVEHELTHITTK